MTKEKLVLAALIFLAFSYSAIALGCDYKIEILMNGSEFEPKSLEWKIRATKIAGYPTNVTGTVEVADSKGSIIKNYTVWDVESISRQKTSYTYSPNFNDGRYNIKAELKTDCVDENESNNLDVKSVTIAEQAPNENTNSSAIENKIPESLEQDGACNKEIIEAELRQAWQNEVKNVSAVEVTEPEKVKQTADEQFDNVIYSSEKNKIAGCSIEQVYESSNWKIRNSVVIVMLVFSMILNIVLIWKR